MPSERSGRYVTFGSYRCFAPAPLPPCPPLVFDRDLTLALSGADRALARLDGAALTLPNPDLFVYAFMRQEAALSSQIEGTQASLEDLFEYEAVPEAAHPQSDVTEIINYIAAMRWGLAEIPALPLSKRLVPACMSAFWIRDADRRGPPGSSGRARTVSALRAVRSRMRHSFLPRFP